MTIWKQRPKEKKMMKTHNQASNTEQLIVWQWNCRSIRNKKHSIEAYISSMNQKPDVLCLQEVEFQTSLQGYNRVDLSKDFRAAIYVKKDISSRKHHLNTKEPTANLVEILPTERGKKSNYILNVYSSPTNTRESFIPYSRRPRKEQTRAT